jgi:hypothetical protein
MLAAADAAAGTGSLTQQFGQQTPDIAREGDIVAVAAVIGKNKILFAELTRKGQRRELLAHAGVNGAVQLSLGEQLEELLLHLADAKGLADNAMMYDQFISQHYT